MNKCSRPSLFSAPRTLALCLLLLLPGIALAAPQFGSSSTTSASSNVTTLTIATPTNTASGDFLLATISTDGSTTFNTPADWTLLDQGQSSGSESTLAVFYRIATSVEPANHTFTWTGSEQAAGAILRYTGVSTSNPIDAFAAGTGQSTNPTSPAATALSADTRVVRVYGADDDDLSGTPYPSGTTGRVSEESSGSGGSSSLGVADSTQLATGGTGTASFTQAASEQWRALTIVLPPSGINPLPPGDSNSAPAVCGAAAASGGGNISGTVNRYYPGSASVTAGATSITLGASIGAGAAIAAGDLLLVIQMQDATIDSANNANYGDGSATGTADGSGSTAIRQTGLYEFVTATNTVATGGGTVTLASGLTHSYNRGTNRRFQVVRVPQYGSATLTANITATSWNGLAGGIVALNVQGTLNLNGFSIDVSGQGFRGGDYAGTTATSSGDARTDYVATGVYWGAKGEGIAGGPNVGSMVNTDGYPGGSQARGAPGNGGGGGNDHNAGGGGGSNIGSGGRGGFPYPTGSVGGKGGGRFAGYSGRLLAGGGGGAGHKNNAGGTGVGGNGGGVVFISATTLTPGTGGAIRANGTAGDFSVQDGAGGGGAGGTILVRTASASVTGLSLQASGGNGGDSEYPDNHGPGGGGGGGAIYIDATGASTTVAGGLPGWRRNSAGSAAVTNHGALGGHRGQVAALTSVPTAVACDFGDAPASYSTSSTVHRVDATGGASVNLRIGSIVDFEWLGTASASADADNLRVTSNPAAGSDEDGVTLTAPAGGGGTINASVAVTNTTGSTARLCGWMDIGSPPNGTFEVAERRCANVATGGTTAVPFQWTVSATTTQTYVSRFRVCSTAVECESPTGTASNGEMEDYSTVYNPTVATIGKVSLSVIPVSAFLADMGMEEPEPQAALALLRFYDPQRAQALEGADPQVIAGALVEYLDPDGDGQVATVRWDTLEERGTIGFYVERRRSDSEEWQRLNGDMLPGLIVAPMGGEYWLADPQPRRGETYEYRLIEQEARGTQNTYGPWELSLPR
ncbi:MAG: hypothetical protein KDI33_14215 [Halioglobus sp.]|nr:hypothetical protein [Halioglobus sp.]